MVSLKSFATVALVLGCVTAAACNGGVESSNPDVQGNDGGTTSSSSSSSSSGSTSSSSSGSTSSSSSSGIVTGREPAQHRAVATPCDGVRSNAEPTIPSYDGGGPPASCASNGDCTNGTNGRCTGNPHDGWACTYDLCKTDGDCGGGKVCECAGGFRADNDVCLQTQCHVDADCGTGGFCSPSLGPCGNYGKTVGYFCHTSQDECVDDTDCPGQNPDSGACRFESTVGHWKCSTSQCAG